MRIKLDHKFGVPAGFGFMILKKEDFLLFKDSNVSSTHLHVDILNRSKLINIRFAASTSQDTLFRQCMQLGNISTQDFISAAHTRICRHDRIILSTNGECRTTIKVIGGETFFVGRLGHAMVNVRNIVILEFGIGAALEGYWNCGVSLTAMNR